MAIHNRNKGSSYPPAKPGTDNDDEFSLPIEFDPPTQEDEERPTAVPPEPFYDQIVRKATASSPSAADSATTETQDDVPEIEVVDQDENNVPVFGHRISGAQEIPLELDFDDTFPSPDSPDTPRSERPTTPRLDLDMPEDLRLPQASTEGRRWPETPTAKFQPSAETLQALRHQPKTHPIQKAPPKAHITDEDDKAFQPLPVIDSSQTNEETPAPTELDLALDSVLGDALGLVAGNSTDNLTLEDIAQAAEQKQAKQEDPRMVKLRDRFELGDFTGAHEQALAILADEPNNQEAIRFRDNCRDILVQMYTSRLGSLHGIPRVVVAPDDMRWLSLDHRAGFILSCIDGGSSVEEIMDVSGMSSLETLRLLFQLLQQQVIEIG